MEADRAETLTRRPLAHRRAEILERLRNLSFELAEAYEVALWLLDNPSIPARGRLLAHCARELINRLPDYLDVPVPAEQVQYKNALDSISALWEAETSGDGTPGKHLSQASEETSTATTEGVTVSRRLYREIDALVTRHKQSLLATEARLSLIFRPSGQTGGHFATTQLAPWLRQWKALRRWFVGHAHFPNPGIRPLDFGECEARFSVLERVLYAMLSPFYPAVEELDAILEEANEPTD